MDTGAFLGLPRAPPSRPFARVTGTLCPGPSSLPRAVCVGAPHFASLLSVLGPGLVWVGLAAACLGGVVLRALLRSSSPAVSLTRYGLEGASAVCVGVSTLLVPYSHRLPES